ncbi:MAG: adenine phosphoribosyltransferase [Thermoplasmatota archaeon]
MTALDESLIGAQVIQKGEYSYIIHPLLDGVPRADPALLREWVAWAKDALEQLPERPTVLLAPEAMALPLAAALSLATDIPYLVVRKREYGLPGETVAYCETGYGESCLYVNGLEAGDRVLVVDDVLSTGGTLQGLLSTLDQAQVPVCGVLVAVDKGTAAAGLARRHQVRIEAMRTIRVEEGAVHLEEEGA